MINPVSIRDLIDFPKPVKVSYQHVESCEGIDFVKENWYLMAWGMGDAINAVFFLEGQSPVPYKILCPPRNWGAIKFVLDNFVPNPKCKVVCTYAQQEGYPIPQEEVVMSAQGFGPQNVGMAHQIGKLKVVHTSPRVWCNINNLHQSGIFQSIEEYGKKYKFAKEKTCILFPERGDSYQLPDSFWMDIVSTLNRKGYKTYVNSTDKSDVYKNEKVFDGTEKLDKPYIKDLFDFIVHHENIITIGQRSGIFDLLKYFDFRKIIFYPDVVDPEMPDKERTNVADVIFEGDTHARNVVDVLLSKYDKNLLELIIP